MKENSSVKSEISSSLKLKWSAAFKDRKFLLEFLITLFLLIITLIGYSNFLNNIELRNGFRINDPVLALFEPIDLTWLIFVLVYSGIILFIIRLIKNPGRINFAFQCYIVLILVRIISMYLVPLDPPRKLIPLGDPIVEFFGSGKALTKDLFFSGHTATLFLFFLLSKNRIFKIIFLSSSIIVAASVLLQHVHYTIDIIFAFLFAYLVYNFTLYFRRLLKLNLRIKQE